MGTIRNRVTSALSSAIQTLLGGELPPEDFNLEVSIPKLAEHGDYATNAAMLLARVCKRKPRDIAADLTAILAKDEQLFQRIDIAGPGFINFFLQPDAWRSILPDILGQDEAYGRTDRGGKKRVQVEFVSANPTGPLHIGHGRGAIFGDAIAAILDANGYDVDREYYINDAGKQMETLGRSLYYRYLQLLGEDLEFPENHYQGDYMMELAEEFLEEHGEVYRDQSEEDYLTLFTEYAGSHILEGIREDLADFGVTHDTWFSEKTLHEKDEIHKTIEFLEKQGHIYHQDGATWFRSTPFGDEKDRVVVRANGISTYFAADLAYHKEKFDRGYDLVIDVWGADHHGYVERMLAGIQAMGRDRSDLRLMLVQLVNLLRNGEPIAMSTRAGAFVTLREVLDEVGRDAARYIFLTRRSDSHLDFDLELAKQATNDNPVFYVQYAHARLCSIFEKARAERGIETNWTSPPDLSPLVEDEEFKLIKMLGEYPDLLVTCADLLEPHRIPYYLHELVSSFHGYYNRHRILSDDAKLTEARLYLAAAMRTVIRNALTLLGVSAPEKM